VTTKGILAVSGTTGLRGRLSARPPRSTRDTVEPVVSPRWPRFLLVLAALTTLAALAATLLAVVDPQQVTGVDRWVKPWKFSVSITVYVLTLAWMTRLVRRHRRTAVGAAFVGAAVMVVELAVIIAQAARGRASHFNTQTPLDAKLFFLMGQMIVLAWLATLVLAIVLLRERMAGAGLATGVRWGIGVTLIGMMSAFLMVEPLNRWAEARAGGPPSLLAGSHTIGALDGGPGLPLLGWSTVAGDLRIGHFVGLHALQLLPLLGWLLDRSPRWTDHQRRGLVRVAGAAWLGLVVLLLWQALRAEPLIHPGASTLEAAAVLVALVVVAVGALLRFPGPRRGGVPAVPAQATPAS
jgi:hypothetical protein